MNLYKSLLLFSLFFVFSCKNKDQEKAFEIKKGDFKNLLTETGELQAVNAKVVFMPYVGWRYGWQFKITGLVNHGSYINKGDSIACFDGSNVKRSLLEEQNKLEVEKTKLNKLIIEQDLNLKAAESRIRSSEAAANLKRLQVEKFRFETDKKRKIKEKELEKATIELEKAKNNYKLSKSVFENDLKIQKIRIKQIEKNILNAESALKQLVIKSPLTGIMQIMENRRTRSIFQIGDEVQQGGAFTLIPDLSQMKVKTSINESDINKIFAGQEVSVRLDAFPLKSFNGEISSIGKLSHKKSNDIPLKIFDVEVFLKDSDQILKPGMTVNCDIHISEIKDTYFIENECIFRDSLNYYILLDNGKGKIRRDITIGPSNAKYTVISGDFKEGLKVLPGSQKQKEI